MKTDIEQFIELFAKINVKLKPEPKNKLYMEICPIVHRVTQILTIDSDSDDHDERVFAVSAQGNDILLELGFNPDGAFLEIFMQDY